MELKTQTLGRSKMISGAGRWVLGAGRWALEMNHSGSAMFYKFNYSFCVIGNYFSCSFTLTNHINLKTSFYTLTELKTKGNLVVQTSETC